MKSKIRAAVVAALALAGLHGGAGAFDILGATGLIKNAIGVHRNMVQGHSRDAVKVVLPMSTSNFSACLENFANGMPPVVKDQAARRARALCFRGFAVLHSGVTKTPIYAAEVLNRERVQAAKKEQRTNNFFADARLPASERATLEDYRGSGLDRGHMLRQEIRIAQRAWCKASRSQT